jgi:hypothetical protein
VDPCRGDRTRQRIEAITAEAAVFSRQEQSRTEAEIEAAAARAFAGLEPGIDRYLDWYFSIPGEYGRLWQAVAGDGAAFIGGKFKDMVIGEGALEARLAGELGRIETRSNGRMRAMAQAHAESLRNVLDASRCLAAALPEMEQQRPDGGPRHVAGAAAGSLAGVAAGAAVATRLGARVAAGRGAMGAGRLAATALGRTAGKRGASAGGAAAAAALVCSPSGPGALLCGAAAGVGTWLGVDALVLRGDEWLNREAMRAEILAGLDDSRDALIAALGTANAARIASAVEEIEASRNALFAPIREGLGRDGRLR